MRLLPLLSVLASCAAADLAVVGDAAVRSGVPFTVTVTGRDCPDGILRVQLDQDGAIASDALPVTSEALAAGVRLCLLPERHRAIPARLIVSLGRPTGGLVVAAGDQTVPTAAGIRADFLTAADAPGAIRDETGALWRMLGLQALDEPPSLAALDRVADCTRALGGTTPTRLAELHPWRDPIDGGLRALRIVPGQRPTVVVLGAADGSRLAPGRRLLIPTAASPAWLAGRLAAIVGDEPIVVVGIGPGLVAAQAVAGHGAPVILVDGPSGVGGAMACTLTDLPHALALADARPMTAMAVTAEDLSAYADGPFTVVVGTGEHAASASDNADLAADFARAWRLYAGAPPRQIADTAPVPAGNLVLIGNPRSNRALAGLVEDGLVLPMRWDHRTVTLGERTLHRSLRPAIACGGRLHGRAILVLDGSPAWIAAGTRPLTGAVGPILSATAAP